MEMYCRETVNKYNSLKSEQHPQSHEWHDCAITKAFPHYFSNILGIVAQQNALEPIYSDNVFNIPDEAA